MTATDHKAKAEALLDQASRSTGDPTVWLLAAQAEATLALVEQQRIGNLLSALTRNVVTVEPTGANFSDESNAGSVNRNDLRAQIREGLDLS